MSRVRLFSVLRVFADRAVESRYTDDRQSGGMDVIQNTRDDGFADTVNRRKNLQVFFDRSNVGDDPGGIFTRTFRLFGDLTKLNRLHKVSVLTKGGRLVQLVDLKIPFIAGSIGSSFCPISMMIWYFSFQSSNMAKVSINSSAA